jgi:hypothetical protein
MMPGARFFIITRPVLYLVRWKGRESPLQSVTKGRCSPHPPCGPFAVKGTARSLRHGGAFEVGGWTSENAKKAKFSR